MQPEVRCWPAELSSCGMVTERAGGDPPSQEPVGAAGGHPVHMVLLETCCPWVSPDWSLMQTSVLGVVGHGLGLGCITGVRDA